MVDPNISSSGAANVTNPYIKTYNKTIIEASKEVINDDFQLAIRVKKAFSLIAFIFK